MAFGDGVPHAGCIVCDAANMDPQCAYLAALALGAMDDVPPERELPAFLRERGLLCFRHCHKLVEWFAWQNANVGKEPGTWSEEPGA